MVVEGSDAFVAPSRLDGRRYDGWPKLFVWGKM